MRTLTRALRAALPLTLPVLTGYLFLGMAFGILMVSQGYAPHWPILMSLVIYAGSMQFAMVGLLAGGFAPLDALILSLMVNARHIFYGIAMLPRYRGAGAAKPYLIFSLTDETFSLLSVAPTPPGVPDAFFQTVVSALDQLYFAGGTALGALAGSALTINTQGIEFAMTALFTVIFLEHWRSGQGHAPALAGIAVAAVCRLLFGAQWFLLPTMAALAVLLLLEQNSQP